MDWSKATDVDLWIMIWEEVRRIHQEGVHFEIEHVKAHRSKEKQQMSLFEHFVTESNQKADELAKDGAMMMEARWLRYGPAQSAEKKRGCTRLCRTNGTIVKSSSRCQNKSGSLWTKSGS